MIDLSKLSKQKITLLEACYYGILQADDDKITNVLSNYYSNDDFMEEECTIQSPKITIIRTGISHDLYLNNKECLDDNFEL